VKRVIWDPNCRIWKAGADLLMLGVYYLLILIVADCAPRFVSSLADCTRLFCGFALLTSSNISGLMTSPHHALQDQ
jgi:hypothetical protein